MSRRRDPGAAGKAGERPVRGYLRDQLGADLVTWTRAVRRDDEGDLLVEAASMTVQVGNPLPEYLRSMAVRKVNEVEDQARRAGFDHAMVWLRLHRWQRCPWPLPYVVLYRVGWSRLWPTDVFDLEADHLKTIRQMRRQDRHVANGRRWADDEPPKGQPLTPWGERRSDTTRYEHFGLLTPTAAVALIGELITERGA